MESRKPISVPPSPKLWRKRRLNQPDQSLTDLPVSAVLDTAFIETVEGCDFDWPEGLAVERVHVRIAEIVAAALVLAGFVVLARRTISILILDRSF